MIFPIYRSDENGLTKKILIDSKGLSMTARIMIKLLPPWQLLFL